MGTAFPKGKSMYIEYKIGNKKYKRERLGKIGIITKTMARQIVKKRERQVELGQLGMLLNEIPIFDDIANEYFKYKKEVEKITSWSRTEHSLNLFSKYFGNKKLTEINAQDIDRYKSERLNKVNPSTLRRELDVISNLFNTAKKWKKHFGENPVVEAGKPKVKNQKERIISKEEEKALINSLDEPVRSFVRIALLTGCRMSEIIGMEWNWIDFDNEIITIPNTATKNKEVKKLPIAPEQRKIFIELKLKAGTSNYVFPSDKSNTGHIRSPLKTFKRHCKKLGIKNLRIHDLRHSTASRLSELGFDVVTIMKVLGHKDIRTTLRYTHPSGIIKEAMQKLSNFS